MNDTMIIVAPWATNRGQGITTDVQRKAPAVYIGYQGLRIRPAGHPYWQEYHQQVIYDEITHEAELTSVLLGNSRER